MRDAKDLRGSKTTEWKLVLLCLFLVTVSANFIPEKHIIVALTLLTNSYILGRSYYKKNRGLFHPSYMTTEFYIGCYGVSMLLLYLLSHTAILWVFWGVLSIVINFILCRSLVKSIGVTTQFITH